VNQLKPDSLAAIERDIRVMARTRHVAERDADGSTLFVMGRILQSELLDLEARIFAIRCGTPRMVKASAEMTACGLSERECLSVWEACIGSESVKRAAGLPDETRIQSTTHEGVTVKFGPATYDRLIQLGKSQVEAMSEALCSPEVKVSRSR